MPVKTHILTVEEGNKITIPKSVCDAVGLANGVMVRLKMDSVSKNYPRFYVETVPTMDMYYESENLKHRLEEKEALIEKLGARLNDTTGNVEFLMEKVEQDEESEEALRKVILDNKQFLKDNVKKR